jgi:hypothetical protein
MARGQRLLYTAQDIMVVWHQGYLLAIKDIRSDLQRAETIDELRTAIEQTLAQAEDSYQAALRRQKEVDGVG